MPIWQEQDVGTCAEEFLPGPYPLGLLYILPSVASGLGTVGPEPALPLTLGLLSPLHNASDTWPKLSAKVTHRLPTVSFGHAFFWETMEVGLHV